MPKKLLKRCNADSIGEFRAAAQQRFHDGLALAAGDRRTAAIYLWGYAAEITLKAAYFGAIGFPALQPIDLGDLSAAKSKAKGLGIVWTGNFHDVQAWARLLVATRATTPGLAYAVPGFGNQVVSQGQQLENLWHEALRYHKNIAYAHEVNQVGKAAQWLLANASSL